MIQSETHYRPYWVWLAAYDLVRQLCCLCLVDYPAPYRKILLPDSGSHFHPRPGQFKLVQAVRKTCGTMVIRNRLNYLVSAFAIEITGKTNKRDNRPMVLDTI